MTDPWDEEFEPSIGTRNVLRWASEHGATTLGEAVDLLEQFEFGNDVPEVLGHDDTIDAVREDLEFGLDVAGGDTPLTTLL